MYLSKLQVNISDTFKKVPRPLHAIHFSQLLAHFSNMIPIHSLTASSKSPVQFPWSLLEMKNNIPSALLKSEKRKKSLGVKSQPYARCGTSSIFFWAKMGASPLKYVALYCLSGVYIFNLGTPAVFFEGRHELIVWSLSSNGKYWYNEVSILWG